LYRSENNKWKKEEFKGNKEKDKHNTEEKKKEVNKKEKKQEEDKSTQVLFCLGYSFERIKKDKMMFVDLCH